MQRFILRFQGSGTPPSEDLTVIRTASGITVVDTAPAMMLIEAAVPDLERLMTRLPVWLCTPERFIPLPDPKRRLPRT